MGTALRTDDTILERLLLSLDDYPAAIKVRYSECGCLRRRPIDLLLRIVRVGNSDIQDRLVLATSKASILKDDKRLAESSKRSLVPVCCPRGGAGRIRFGDWWLERFQTQHHQ